MKLILTSDTHYGFDAKTPRIHEKFWRQAAESIKKEDVKALILAGDLTSHRQKQFRRTLEHVRQHINIPIVLVRGNHDWWDSPEFGRARRRGFEELNATHQEWFEDFEVWHLENGPYVIDDVIICGWDGWYGSANPPTNDARFMFPYRDGVDMHLFMSNRAAKQLDRVLETDLSGYRAALAVTHFPTFVSERKWEQMCANLKFHEMIINKFDVFCVGHSHNAIDAFDGKCRILNSGSDYNQPRYKLFEV